MEIITSSSSIWLLIIATLSGSLLLINIFKSSTFLNKNDGEKKAAEVMSNIFSSLLHPNGDRWLFIYAKDLNGDISEKNLYLPNLIKLIESGCKIKVLIDKAPLSGNNQKKDSAYKIINIYKAMGDRYKNLQLESLEGINNKEGINCKVAMQQKLIDLFDQELVKKKIKIRNNENKITIVTKELFKEGHFAIASNNSFRFEYNQDRHLAFFSIGPRDKSFQNRFIAKSLKPKLKKIFEDQFEKFESLKPSSQT